MIVAISLSNIHIPPDFRRRPSPFFSVTTARLIVFLLSDPSLLVFKVISEIKNSFYFSTERYGFPAFHNLFTAQFPLKEQKGCLPKGDILILHRCFLSLVSFFCSSIFRICFCIFVSSGFCGICGRIFRCSFSIKVCKELHCIIIQFLSYFSIYIYKQIIICNFCINTEDCLHLFIQYVQLS